VLNLILDHPTTGHAMVATLRAAGGFVPLRVPAVVNVDRKFASPSGKIEFYSLRAERLGLPPLPINLTFSERGSLKLNSTPEVGKHRSTLPSAS
jgi:hypothetical protein